MEAENQPGARQHNRIAKQQVWQLSGCHHASMRDFNARGTSGGEPRQEVQVLVGNRGRVLQRQKQMAVAEQLRRVAQHARLGSVATLKMIDA